MADFVWITPRLAIGSVPDASWLPAMRRAGITDVLDLRGEPTAHERPMPEVYDSTGIRYFYLPMLDRGGPQPPSAYQKGVALIRAVLAQPGRKILVHCAAGVSRSPSMAYAYLRSLGQSPQEAWNMVTRARPQADDQYVASAEASVRLGTGSPGTSLGLFAVIAVGAYALYIASVDPVVILK